MKPVLPNIFNYHDFKVYLADYVKSMKAIKPNFSYQYFSDKAGFRNKGFAYNLLQGRKHLSRQTTFGLIKAMGLTRPEAEYFENMVAFGQAATPQEQAEHYRRMLSSAGAKNRKTDDSVLRKDQYEYYSKFYHSVIRSILDLLPIRDDWSRLARQVQPEITPSQARLSVELLCRLGLLCRQKNGTYRLASKTITSGPVILGPEILQFHMAMAELAIKALKETPRSRRHISGLTLGISEKGYELMVDEIREFRKRLLKIAEKDAQADRVYHMAFHFFPVSKPLKEG